MDAISFAQFRFLELQTAHQIYNNFMSAAIACSSVKEPDCGQLLHLLNLRDPEINIFCAE